MERQQSQNVSQISTITQVVTNERRQVVGFFVFLKFYFIFRKNFFDYIK